MLETSIPSTPKHDFFCFQFYPGDLFSFNKNEWWVGLEAAKQLYFGPTCPAGSL